MDPFAGDASTIAILALSALALIVALLLVLLCFAAFGIKHRLDLATELLARLVERTPPPAILNRGNARPGD